MLSTLPVAHAGGYATNNYKSKFCRAVSTTHEISSSITKAVLYLGAHWKTSSLKLYDTESWSQPEVDPSASEEVMAGEYTAPAFCACVKPLTIS